MSSLLPGAGGSLGAVKLVCYRVSHFPQTYREYTAGVCWGKVVVEKCPLNSVGPERWQNIYENFSSVKKPKKYRLIRAVIFLQQRWMSLSPRTAEDGLGVCKATGHIRREASV